MSVSDVGQFKTLPGTAAWKMTLAAFSTELIDECSLAAALASQDSRMKFAGETVVHAADRGSVGNRPRE
jgi:hypothetical protein